MRSESRVALRGAQVVPDGGFLWRLLWFEAGLVFGVLTQISLAPHGC